MMPFFCYITESAQLLAEPREWTVWCDEKGDQYEWAGYKEMYAGLALKYRETLRVARVRKGVGQRR